MLVIEAEERSFGGIIDFISIFGFSFCGVLQSLIVGKVTLTSKRLRILPIVDIIVVLQGDLETFDAILLSIFSLTLHGDSNIRYVFIDSIE